MSSARLVLRPEKYGVTDDGMEETLVAMGFPKDAVLQALEATERKSIDAALELLTGSAAQVSGFEAQASQPSTSSHSQPPSSVTQLDDLDKVKSSFDLEARNAHARREQEERAKQVKMEQQKKKEANNKVKMQLNLDKLTRRLMPKLKLAEKLSVEEVSTLIDEIKTCMDENGKNEDIVSMLRDFEAIKKFKGSDCSAGAGAAAGGTAAQTQKPEPQKATTCMIRVRLDDGTTKTEQFQTSQNLGEVVAWIATHRSDDDFSVMEPGGFGVEKRDLNEKLDSTLQELGFVPNGTLTVQANAKKDMVTAAPEGARFPTQRPPVRGGPSLGGMPGMARMSGMMRMGGMRGMGQGMSDEEDDDEEEDEDDYEDPMDSEQDFAAAQSASLDTAVDEAYRGLGSDAAPQLKAEPIQVPEGLNLDQLNIPDEFLDPITSTLMLNPVTLPSSGAVMDMTTIKKHLLRSNVDPYSQTPLTLAQLSPNGELSGKIEAWLKQKAQA